MRKYRKVKFSYQGSGNANTLELKLVDDDNTNFGRNWLKSTNSGWREIEVPFNEFEYWWYGNDSYLDCSKIDIWFAISMKEGDEGGSGTVEIKGLEFLP